MSTKRRDQRQPSGACPPFGWTPRQGAELHKIAPDKATLAHAAVYIALCCSHNTKRGQCNPSAAQLAAITGYSTRTVFRALCALEEWGLIERTEAERADGGQGSNHYRICHLTPMTQSVIPPRDTGDGGSDSCGQAPHDTRRHTNREFEQRSDKHSDSPSGRTVGRPPAAGRQPQGVSKDDAAGYARRLVDHERKVDPERARKLSEGRVVRITQEVRHGGLRLTGDLERDAFVPADQDERRKYAARIASIEADQTGEPTERGRVVDLMNLMAEHPELFTWDAEADASNLKNEAA